MSGPKPSRSQLWLSSLLLLRRSTQHLRTRSIVDLQRDQIDNGGSSVTYSTHGTDKPVVVQEQEQLGNPSAATVDPVSAKGGRSPGAIEQQALPGAE